MPDDRSSGFGGRNFITFNSHDNSGRVTGIPDKKRSKDQSSQQEEETEEKKDEFKTSEFVDRSAQLSASLDSLAMLNAARVFKKNLPDSHFFPSKNSDELTNK